MLKRWYILFLLFMPFVSQAQNTELSPDFRQHNLTLYNASLFDPVYSLDRNDPRSLALWTRWQWQTVDGDPTTLLFNYTHRLNINSAGGLGFFQHNTGLFLETGVVLNFTYNFELGPGTSLAIGLNTFGYQRKPADDRFQADPDNPLPQFDVPNDFILQFAPGLRFQYYRFSIGLVGENLLDYNVTANEKATNASDKVYLLHTGYRIPVFLFGSDRDSYVQPTLYLKTIPGLDDQYGLTALLATPIFWAQLGYNSFYGASAGAGGRFFKDFSIGALIEFGSENSLRGDNTSFEFVTAYNFGNADLRRRVIGFEPTGEELAQVTPVERKKQREEAKAAAEAARQEAEALAKKEKDSIAAVKEQEALLAAGERRERNRKAREQKEQDSLALLQQERVTALQKRSDSIAAVRREEALALARKQEEEKRRDSLAQATLAAEQAATEKVVPQPGEKYEETTTEDGLTPGYYLIANVFGTKKYFDAFMKTLSGKGLEPKSFYRSANKYNYVYLRRYNSIDEARAARESKFGGRYADDLWIFRVVGQ